MWRVVNFRSFLLTMICCVLSALVCALCPVAVALMINAAVATAFLLWGVLSFKKETAVRAAAFLICFLCIGAISISTLVDKASRVTELDTELAHEIVAVVDAKNVSDTGATLLLTDISAGEREIDGKISLRVYSEDGATLNFLREGDAVKFTAMLRYVSPYDSAFDSGYAFRNDVRYYATVDESAVIFVEERAKLFARVRNKISTVFNENLGEYGSLAYGMITGKSGEISDDVRSYYSASGLGHILAVSGLHVGFVTLILCFILDKLRSTRPVKLISVFLVLLGYCFLAGFSPSVVRASIMCIVGLTAQTLGRNGDGLNSLCFAVTVILVARPMYVFDVGFIMSVSAVLGILFFSGYLERALAFLPGCISKPLIASVSAQIGITPVMLAYFGSIPTYSILTNLIMIPVVTIAFILLSITLIVALIIPKAAIAVSFAGIPLAFVDTVAKLVSTLPLAEIRVFTFGGIIGLLLLYFLCSKYFMLPRFKWVVAVVTVTVGVVSLAVYNKPLDGRYDYATSGGYRDVTSVIRTADGVALVGDCTDYRELDGMLTALRERRVDAVYLTSCSDKTAAALSAMAKEYDLGEIYYPSVLSSEGMFALAEAGLSVQLFDCDDETKYVDAVFVGSTVAYKYTEGSVSILMVGNSARLTSLPLELINECAIIRASSYYGYYPNRVYLSNFHNEIVSTSPEREIVLAGEAYALDLSTGRAVMI